MLSSPLAAFVLMLGYVLLIEVLGFYSATVLFLIAFMYYMNVRSPLTLLSTTGILISFIYLLFSVALKVRLPVGLLL